MAIRPDYTAGTITLVSGSDAFTTTGAALQSAAIQQGDTIYLPAKGMVLTIASITGQNAGTLTGNCPAGAAGAAQAYAIRFQPDGSRLSGKTQALVELLGNGNVEALAGLALAADKLPYATGAGTMDLVSFPAGSRTQIAAGLGSAATKTAQTSTSDTTANALMGVGAFGIGAGGVIIPNNDYNQAVVSGIYSGSGASSINPPPNSTSYGPLLVMTRGTTSIVQIAGFGGSANANALCYRGSVDSGATWSAWAAAGDVVGPASAVANRLAMFDGTTGKLIKDSGSTTASFATAAQGSKADSAYQKTNIVGTVAQSGGVPTGAIIETGSNSNGTYIKYADGTLICWVSTTASVAFSAAYGNLFIGSYTWSFPASFIATPAVVCTQFNQSGTVAMGAVFGTPSTGSAGLRGLDVASRTAATTSISAIATGRWF